MRVLLIEDDTATAKSIELMLKSEDYLCDSTDLGEDGLDIGKLYDYDLIILDLMLPDMDGLEVLRRMRTAKVQTPILILSGLSLLAAVVIIANAVALSTLERRKELGLLKTVGAKARWVVVQLLIENTLLGFVGGLIGLAIAFAALLVRGPMRRGFGAGAWGIVLATIVVQAAFAGLVLSYHRTMSDPGAEPWGPFPAPTTWMLLIFYPSQLLFVLCYVVGFRRWMWTADDEASFERIVSDARAERSG